MRILRIILALFSLSFPLIVGAYDACTPPTITNIDVLSTTSVNIEWIDSDDQIISFELEVIPDIDTTRAIPNYKDITASNLWIDNLLSNTRYKLYIRNKCSEGVSPWNGPFFFNTHLSNPSLCGIGLPLSDDNCPNEDRFIIEVNDQEAKMLGKDIYLSSVDLLIRHDWPADLRIELQNPSGSKILLSANNGIGLDDYGGFNNEFCGSLATFSDESCQSIKVLNDSIVGIFKPEMPLNSLNDLTLANGNWNLIICDRAFGDIGILEFVRLNFTPLYCEPINQIQVIESASDSITFSWESNDTCDSLTIEYGPLGFVLGTGQQVVIDCHFNQFTLENLNPQTTYDLYLTSNCSLQNNCPIQITTRCNPISHIENFNSLGLCEPSCGTSCNIFGLWHNVSTDDHDWIVNEGSTKTERTGPSQDVSGDGKYIYIEGSGQNCSQGSAALESSCLSIVSNEDHCDLGFMYHMYGVDIGTLSLEITIDAGESWEVLWRLNGDQGDQWHQADIDLSNYNGMIANLRFVKSLGTGIRNDMALDDIILYGSTILVMDRNVYYRDRDGDSYGDSLDSVLVCGGNIPQGYTTKAGDCDDQNPNINPGAIERPCNLVDENCNGDLDDIDATSELHYELVQLNDEICPGSADGLIEIEVTGGEAPYDILWSNGAGFALNDNLVEGIYSVSIEDRNGCKIESPPIQINTQQEFKIEISNIVQPSCEGVADGVMSLLVTNGIEPYKYQWSTGDTTATIQNVPAGVLSVTISDSNECQKVVNNLELLPKSALITSVLLNKNVSCYGQNNGQLLVGASNGISPYEYTWNTTEKTRLIVNLYAGKYSCTILDSRGCTSVIDSITVTEPEELAVIVVGKDDPTCFQGSDGSIDILAQGGTMPYSYSWNNGAVSEDLLQARKGNYRLTVTDNNACTAASTAIEIIEPPQLEVDLVEVQDVDCPLSRNGSIEVNVKGGTPEYELFWTNVEEDSSLINDLTSGKYDLTVLDRLGCKSNLKNIIVNNRNKPLDLQTRLLTANQCAMDSIASIEVMLSTGLQPFDYNWSLGVKHLSEIDLDTITGLAAGSYNVTVTDSEGCTGISAAIDIPKIPQLSYSIAEIDEIKCHGDSTGRLKIIISGGMDPYHTIWNTGLEGNELTNVAAGIYSFQSIDDNDCLLQSEPIQLQQPRELDFYPIFTKPSSSTALDGSIEVVVTGGRPIYTILWGENANHQTGSTASKLGYGEYSFEVIDAVGCSATFSVKLDSTTATSTPIFNNKIRIWPNPASESIMIQYEGELSIKSILILNLQGQKLLHQPWSSESKVLEINNLNLENGYYLLQISTANQQAYLPFIIVN